MSCALHISPNTTPLTLLKNIVSIRLEYKKKAHGTDSSVLSHWYRECGISCPIQIIFQIAPEKMRHGGMCPHMRLES